MRLAIALGLICAVVWGSVRSDEPAVYTLHIESQPLDSALQEFARQTGMQILFFSDVTNGLRSAALDGKYTVEKAMTILLSGSNLTYRLINARTIQIVPLPAAPGKIRHWLFPGRMDAADCAQRGNPHVTRR
jgi:hypothetical protein